MTISIFYWSLKANKIIFAAFFKKQNKNQSPWCLDDSVLHSCWNVLKLKLPSAPTEHVTLHPSIHHLLLWSRSSLKSRPITLLSAPYWLIRFLLKQSRNSNKKRDICSFKEETKRFSLQRWRMWRKISWNPSFVFATVRSVKSTSRAFTFPSLNVFIFHDFSSFYHFSSTNFQYVTINLRKLKLCT